MEGSREGPGGPLVSLVTLSDGSIQRTMSKMTHRVDAEPERLLTPQEVAERWALSEDTLRRWRSEGCGPNYVRLGGRIRYRLAEVMRYEASMTNV